MSTTVPDPGVLREITGLMLPGDPGYEQARTPWNLAAVQHPVAVAEPTTVADAARIVTAVTAAGFRIAPQASGHGAMPLAERGVADAVLLRLHRLTGVEIDPRRRTARVRGGTVWREVIDAASEHGLAALHGSAADVSVSGYVLGGGLSFYARQHGLAAHHVRAFEVITATGELVRATAQSHPDLFWALRGGCGGLGAVVEIEMDLLPVPEVQAGFLLWDMSRASAVLPVWRDWTRGLDPCATTSLRLMHFPPIPDLPPFLSGRSVLIIDGAILADDARTAELLRPLRELQPELDTFARMPAAGLAEVHMDPPEPAPAVGDHAMLGALDDEALAALLSVAGQEAGDVPMFAELRHLGGALAEPRHGALRGLDGEYALFTVDMVPAPELMPAAVGRVARVVEAMRDWRHGAPYLGFVDRAVRTADAFDAETIDRLDRVRAEYDPRRVWVAAHPLPGARRGGADAAAGD
ncbi:FAD-dependent oxidoreductase [Microbacterium soli]|uniref:FAD-binding oxidoreductase n=1 Tax=Microbacterium soli TaxID=446075 RepID=A0ABP7N526_9MICO